MDKKDREAILEQMPWIDRIQPKERAGLPMCDGIKWSKVSLKHLYSMGGKPPLGIPNKARCSLQARWRFRARRNSRARTGNYCIHHLFAAGLYHDEFEAERTDGFFKSLSLEAGH